MTSYYQLQSHEITEQLLLSDHADNTWALTFTWPARIAALGLIVGMAFSAPLWTNIDRTLPLAPLVNIGWLQLLTPFLTVVTIFSALLVILCRSIRLICFALIASISMLVILDLNRLQPWVYEYCLILALTLFKARGKTEDPQGSLKYLALLLICMYFFSGIQKMNWHFLTETGPWLCGFQASPVSGLGNATMPILVSAILCTAEVLISILLICKTTRLIGLGGVLMMHLAILVMLGPQSLNFNAVIWPWNVIQMMLLLGCFWHLKVSGKSLMHLDFKNEFKCAAVITVAGLLLPLLGLLQLVDPYLAFALYTGDAPYGTFYFDSAAHAKLTRRIQKVCSYDKNSKLWKLEIINWGFAETNAPCYPSAYCFKAMASSFDSTYKPDRFLLRISRYPKLSRVIVDEDIVVSDSTN